ncbi:InlB B-repeat-containing protein [Listeria welshimeri]|uniref:InlB B-repeat-containing protein n=1 Tax=Listeria welshimeri TaxID=1643 RepID=UPI001BD4AD9B|nr:InlB B-repeat-containing protein [Listeria welshimeri]MBS9366017.1 InlB B-repeat-containing protein [Listeria welshimeri]
MKTKCILLLRITQNLLALMLIAAVSMWIIIGNETEVQADTITQPTAINELFPDSDLAEVMRVELGKTSVNDIISQNELDTLTILNGGNKNIKSIEGIQYLNNLVKIDLNENDISNINNLAGLTNLKNLNLGENLQLKDITALSGLTTLTNFTVGSLELSDISALSNLANLTDLWIASPKLSNISALSNLTNLESLTVRISPISDFSPVANLINLRNLVLDQDGLKDSDLIYLNNLTKLTELSLIDNNISDIRSLVNLTNLTSLSLDDNQIKDISSLSGLANNLSYLNISGQNINNPIIPFQTDLSIPNNVIGIDGTLLDPLPDYISDEGKYNSPNITWNLPTYVPEVNYVYYQTIPINQGETAIFQGIVYQPLQEEAVSYKVVFNIEGKETNEMVEVDSFLEEPATPTKEGYTFTGWYDAKIGGNKWDFASDTMPANDITLYAQFSINNYTATFNIDGKETTESVAYQNLVTEPTAPVKEGYTFTGWYDAKTGGNKWDFASDIMPANNITLYARFAKNTSPKNDKGTPAKGKNGSNTNMKLTASPNPIEGKTSKPSNKQLPSTGDENNFLPIFLGVLCISLASVLVFWRRQLK